MNQAGRNRQEYGEAATMTTRLSCRYPVITQAEAKRATQARVVAAAGRANRREE